jgi:hypothetical protein
MITFNAARRCAARNPGSLAIAFATPGSRSWIGASARRGCARRRRPALELGSTRVEGVPNRRFDVLNCWLSSLRDLAVLPSILVYTSEGYVGAGQIRDSVAFAMRRSGVRSSSAHHFLFPSIPEKSDNPREYGDLPLKIVRGVPAPVAGSRCRLWVWLWPSIKPRIGTPSTQNLLIAYHKIPTFSHSLDPKATYVRTQETVVCPHL